jgi:hypothetical protein
LRLGLGLGWVSPTCGASVSSVKRNCGIGVGFPLNASYRRALALVERVVHGGELAAVRVLLRPPHAARLPGRTYSGKTRNSDLIPVYFTAVNTKVES